MESVLAGRTHQYLRTEYIQPPPGPPSLDAKKSPLALLAQTCSAIGKEGPNKHHANDKSSAASDNSDASTKSSGGYHSKPFSKSALLKNRCSANESETSRSGSSVPTRKLSAPVFSKTSLTNAPELRRTSPNILSQEPSTRRTLASTPMGVSDGSSPELSDTKSNKEKSTYDRDSPIKSNSSDRRNSHERSGSATDGIYKNSRLCSVDTDIRRGSSANNQNISPIPNSHTQTKCGCNVTHPFSTACQSQIPVEANKPLKHDAIYPYLPSGCDKFPVGCQYSHLPSACDVSRIKETDPYYSLYPVDSVQPFGLQSAISSPYNRLQSQLLAAAMASRNEYFSTAESNPHVHVCKWVTAAEGHCGKTFHTREGLVEHLNTHTLPTSSVGNNFGLPNFPSNNLSTYFNGSAFAMTGANPTGFTLPNNLSQVALANERLLQSSPRRCSSLHRYSPYKNPFANSLNPYVPMFPPSVTGSTALYNSPYAYCGQPVGAAAGGYLFP